MQPIWVLRKIEHVTDAQFSIAHGLAVGAHRIPPGKAWQSPEVVFNPSVLALMDKIRFDVHPEYGDLVAASASSRPARIEVRARGQSWVGEKRWPKGSPSPDPRTTMTNDELVAKFADNAAGVIIPRAMKEACDLLLNLETVTDVGEVIGLVCS
jgi:2-methylcitrate dehydratase PrpD